MVLGVESCKPPACWRIDRWRVPERLTVLLRPIGTLGHSSLIERGVLGDGWRLLAANLVGGGVVFGGESNQRATCWSSFRLRVITALNRSLRSRGLTHQMDDSLGEPDRTTWHIRKAAWLENGSAPQAILLGKISSPPKTHSADAFVCLATLARLSLARDSTPHLLLR